MRNTVGYASALAVLPGTSGSPSARRSTSGPITEVLRDHVFEQYVLQKVPRAMLSAHYFKRQGVVWTGPVPRTLE